MNGMMAKLGFVPKILSLIFTTNLISVAALADEQQTSVTRQLVAVEALRENPGYSLTAVIVQIEPDTIIGSHTHSGFVFAYVLEGTVRSQLNDDVAVDYQVGDSWVEPSGTLHRLTRNPSKTAKAKILAVFVAETESVLTSPAKKSE